MVGQSLFDPIITATLALTGETPKRRYALKEAFVQSTLQSESLL
jgi:hypothetical protein